ncbi:MAG: DUF1553 domain-containing protein [Pirellulaceae bacterium]|jgi:mono/diheme cytochrome c family protein|nr:DUF1553 domain-containing protein [Pirellulaceae bacterium]MDP7019527.1 DUF1553 domain-containing protein [Pirellulaceae bacterium]
MPSLGEQQRRPRISLAGYTGLSCALALILAALPGARGDEATDHFESRVRPLLIAKCQQCHGKKAKGRLRLDSRNSALAGGKSGAAIVLGKPEQSLIVQAIKRGGRLKMPPGKPLAPREIAAIEQWVKAGAVWPRSDADEPAVETPIDDKARDFWSFRPIVKRPPPKTAGKTNPIDAFIEADLGARQLSPSARANRTTLIRRAAFDLIGLPPTPEEIDAFLADDRPDAFARLVDRLLDSPHYGERWGRHWLDLVRYADTAGDASDFPVPEAYKYRNYVIAAFNNDKPYDEFVEEQIAGDLLPYENDDEHWEHQIATGYLAIARRIGVSPHNLKHITIEDTIDNLGKTFLGLTIGCARCHDHKFDPVPTTDYYALYGIFDSSIYPHAGAEHKPWRQDFVYRIGKAASDKLLKPNRDELEIWNVRERAKLEEYRDFQRKPIADPGKTRETAWQAVLQTREQRRPVAESFPDLDIAYAVHEGSPHDVRVQEQGDPRSPGDLVRRGFPQILGGHKLPADHSTSGRLELARWLTAKDNPLTARVIVNRLWHHHFGKGLVASTSDFGVRGGRPTHPELLDFLAATMVENGWSIKQMHRLIMSSRAYQRSSNSIAENKQTDPENRFLWRFDRRRLDAEQLRDSLLAFSDQLDRTPGGRHPFPHRLTYFYRQHEPFVGNWTTNRRSIYMMQQRIKKNTYLDTFDGPDGNGAIGERKVTTTTLQALYMMNSEFVHQQSDAIAARIVESQDDTPSRVDWSYQTFFGRRPTVDERSFAAGALKRLAGKTGAAAAEPDRQAWAALVRSMLSSNEFMFID